MAIKIGINGFGRIGRMVLRSIIENNRKDIEVVAIGGINSSNYKKILLSGADYIACSSYIWNNKKLNPIRAINKFK